MSKNQLFKIIPDLTILQELLKIFGLESLEDTTFFTKTKTGLPKNLLLVKLS